jgi:2-polyprenyl-6-methoxyphenol hydroxylase-like FAD-dependent oxidoreductase
MADPAYVDEGARGQSEGARGQERGKDYDVAIVGASLGGATAAIMLARAGARVALIEKSPDPQSYKRICGHYIQSSAVPTLERVGLLEPIMRAGAVESRIRVWSRWGWVLPAASSLPAGVNLRRAHMDPLVRSIAAATPGVDLMLGHTVNELLRDGERVVGVCARDTHGSTLQLRTHLVVGADGRGSRVAKLAGVKTKTHPHGRFVYAAYFTGSEPAGYPDSSFWLLDPDAAALFPTDDGQILYAVMPTMEHLPRFRADPAKALVDYFAALPDAPPILAARLVEEADGTTIKGKLDMTNVAHTATAPGLALIGDAVLATDPLWGIGCGWAFQSAEWLADSVAPALLGAESLEQGLERYRRRHARSLRGHAFLIHDYASGRKFSPVERLIFSASTRDERMARIFEEYGTRNIGAERMMSMAVPRALYVNARHALGGRGHDRGQAMAETAGV